jgi:hypothetical protein
MKFQFKPIAQVLGVVIILGATACGGGGGGGNATPTIPAATTVTLSGMVMVKQAIRNAVVCMDLNANSICDANEPTAAKTGADGAYTLSYSTANVTAAQVAAASLIAPMVPGALADLNATIDAADTASTNTRVRYVLKQVPGKSGQINPLTTLVSVGIAGGMTEAVARTNVAAQLIITETKIDNYQDDPLITSATASARVMAAVTAAAIEEGAVLVVGDQQAAITASPNDMRSLRYTDASNFSYLTFNILAKAAGTAGREIEDFRTGKTAGVATAPDVLYNQAYLTAAGWKRCDLATPIQNTPGSPNRSTFCNATNSVGYTVPTSIAGATMGGVVTAMQADSVTNTINNGLTTTRLLTDLGATSYPADSNIALRTNLNLTQPLFINSINTDGFSQAQATTLEQLIANRPASGVTPPNVGSSLNLGLGSGNFKNLRVAFTGITNTTTGAVQFYECDLDASQTIASNCAATSTGTYTISAINGARVMRFAGHAPTVMNHTRAYAEVKNVPQVIGGDWIFIVRESKPDINSNLSVLKRLNATAWAAMKAQLGL